MKLTHGVDETYYKNFILTEDGIKEFHKLMENAVQRFPAPAEIVYTIMTSDLRYFETQKLEDVLHDPAVQDRSVIQLTMEADFIDELPRIEGDVIHTGKRENWNIRVMFTLRQRSFWDSLKDRVNLRVSSEERKWANDYIDRFEEQIYKLPTGGHTPVMLFWLFAIPLTILISAFFTHSGQGPTWLSEPFPRYSYFAAILASALMVLTGASLSLFNFNPQVLRMLFGPMSGFAWGAGKEEHEMFEKFRHMVLWCFGFLFLLVMFASVKFGIS